MNNNTVQISPKNNNNSSVGKKIEKVNISQPKQIYKIVDNNIERLILMSMPII